MNMIIAALEIFLMVGGALFMLLAAIGVVRLPDVLLRMSATSKASALGTIMILVAFAIAVDHLGVVTRVIAAIAFILLTVPVAGHLISRAAYLRDAKLWERTAIDELEGRYNVETGQVDGHPCGDEEHV
jgi:multicomponent Na+:H+ antiporter subunit G